ncbi:PSP1 domain-containing protein [Dialister micraerophilus]|uniref:PSP1 C-terminal domain protein n=1 Tax=Dialister micraerophilus UPII 345-E TaxID=910314 RepID=E4L839_9FIRM|nr:stage 0 sporulation family protein [Dialister micraerophilus]EFR42899.1 PSP1 C-terminal domain protein [Dialister micraerophilus UPII 345-E]
MEGVIGVRFKRAGKIYYFNDNSLDLHLNDGVIVETSRGMEYGHVVLKPTSISISDENLPLKSVIRKATVKDEIQLKRNKEREESAFDICLTKIKKFNFPMRLLRVEYTFDRNKIVFFFTADGRIDFRELVKELAAVFHARIELRQVGVRDEAKQVNGIGPCGRPLCCANFLGEFAPVSIKMAKIQGLSLNPSKISGVCGRLMCCLRYENDQYKNDPERRKTCCKMKKRYDSPNFFVGMKVITEEGSGQVVYVNSQKHTVKIQSESNQVKILPWSEVEEAENE